jgi:hypothetical protein
MPVAVKTFQRPRKVQKSALNEALGVPFIAWRDPFRDNRPIRQACEIACKVVVDPRCRWRKTILDSVEGVADYSARFHSITRADTELAFEAEKLYLSACQQN